MEAMATMGDLQPMDEPRRRFLDLLTQASGTAAPMTLVLSKYLGDEHELLRVQARPVVIRGETCLSFVYRYRSRDVTTNLPLPQALRRVDELLGGSFRQANLQSGALEAQLGFSKRGKALLRTSRGAGRPAADAAEGETKGRSGKQDEVDTEGHGGASDDCGDTPAVPATVAHNREKRRLLSLERPFLRALGVTDSRGHLIPSMARKWKQINRFIEVFADAWRSSGLQQREAPLRLIDFGAGKGYLTFALHDYLRSTLGVAARTHGVELRGDLVKTCNDAVTELGIEGLTFSQGDIASYCAQTVQGAPGNPAFDVMIALHACDTATDDAIHQGIRGRRRHHHVRAVLPQAVAPAAAQPASAAADPAARHPPRPGGGDGDRRPARDAARGLRLRDAGLRVHLARAHQQEQDDPGGEAGHAALGGADPRADRGDQVLLRDPRAAAGEPAARGAVGPG